MKRIAMLALCAICTGFVTHAAVWVVDQGGGGDFLTIQEAIDAAVTGDEVIVNLGTYTENLNYLGKDLWIHSAEGPGTTILDGSEGSPGCGSCVVFQSGESAEAILEGFTLTRGTGIAVTERGVRTMAGGGAACLGSSPTLRACLFADNSANLGGGVFLNGASPCIVNCEFLHNIAVSLGGAVYGSADPTTLLLDGCLFESNIAGWGGGAIHQDPPDGNIHDCVFRNNCANTGGALSFSSYGECPEITDCIFQSNQALDSHGGAIRLHETSATIERSLFFDNFAALDGGGLFAIDGSWPTITNCTFAFNTAWRCGGNIAVLSYSSISVANCIISNALDGGGIYCELASTVFTCTDAWDNAGGNYIGVGDPTGTAGNISADPLFCDPANEDFTLQYCSPCAPFSQPNPECDLIGACPIGCGGTPVIASSWGAIKAMFRE